MSSNSLQDHLKPAFSNLKDLEAQWFHHFNHCTSEALVDRKKNCIILAKEAIKCRILTEVNVWLRPIKRKSKLAQTYFNPYGSRSGGNRGKSDPFESVIWPKLTFDPRSVKLVSNLLLQNKLVSSIGSLSGGIRGKSNPFRGKIDQIGPSPHTQFGTPFSSILEVKIP